MNNPANVLALSGVKRTYRQGDSALDVLQSIDLTIVEGEMVALVGPSGSGKTTLLQIAGLLDRPTEGTVSLLGNDVSDLNDSGRTSARSDKIGFIYQFHHLLPDFTAVENVAMPQVIRGESMACAKARSVELLDKLGLGARLDHHPSELSGGEQQRVAIARALANKPRLILADEPTGNLDPETSDHVFQQLVDTVKDTGVAMLVATHNMQLAQRMDRTVRLVGGKITL